MMRNISSSSGTSDIERTLGLLLRTASGEPRTKDNRVSVEEAGRWYGSASGRAALEKLAVWLDCDEVKLPNIEVIKGLFADELLSSKALKMHRGRNVYDAPKLALWNKLWLPFRDALILDEETLELTERLIHMRTHSKGTDVVACVDFLEHKLIDMGFKVEIIHRSDNAPLIVARRPAINMTGCVAMYNHYDVEDPVVDEWLTDPWSTTEIDGRLYGVGIGDNKAALAVRLIVLGQLTACPELLWIIQGEEETGSPLAHDVVADIVAKVSPTLWLEENGYFEHSGKQRFLARMITAKGDAAPDAELGKLIDRLADVAAGYGLAHHTEHRGLNKSFFPKGCPFNNAIPVGGRYLAIGVNDPDSRIHQSNESVPMWTFPVAALQLKAVMMWAGR